MERISRIGFELECEVNAETEWNTLGVEYGSDGSIASCSSACRKKNMECVEFRSQPYCDIASFDKFFDYIEDLQAEDNYHVNRTMGFHVHVSFTETETDAILTPKTIYSPAFVQYFIAKLKAKYPGVYKTRGDNDYCAIGATANGRTTLDQILHGSRYQAVNFRALRDHRTVEFRIFPADTPEKCKEYLAFTRDTINEFLATDNGRVHYSVKDTLPRTRVVLAEPLYVTDRSRRGEHSTAFMDNCLISVMRQSQQTEYNAIKRTYHVDEARLVRIGKTNRYIPTNTLITLESGKPQKRLTTYRVRKDKKTTITKLSKRKHV